MGNTFGWLSFFNVLPSQVIVLTLHILFKHRGRDSKLSAFPRSKTRVVIVCRDKHMSVSFVSLRTIDVFMENFMKEMLYCDFVHWTTITLWHQRAGYRASTEKRSGGQGALLNSICARVIKGKKLYRCWMLEIHLKCGTKRNCF